MKVVGVVDDVNMCGSVISNIIFKSQVDSYTYVTNLKIGNLNEVGQIERVSSKSFIYILCSYRV